MSPRNSHRGWPNLDEVQLRPFSLKASPTEEIFSTQDSAAFYKELRTTPDLPSDPEDLFSTPLPKSGTIPNSNIAIVLERLKNSPHYEKSRHVHAPFGYYCDRPIIAECTPIHGGIYLSIEPKEAIVVDEKYGSLNTAYEFLLQEFVRLGGTKASTPKVFFDFVVAVTTEVVQLKSEAHIRSLTKVRRRADEKVSLDTFLEEGAGARRHQIILAAYLLEKLKRRRLLRGQIFVDINLTRERIAFTEPAGDYFVFDPAEQARRNPGRSSRTSPKQRPPDFSLR